MDATLIHIFANKIDPTHTSALRNAFAQDMKRRFNELAWTVRKAVVVEDVFGLNSIQTHQMNTPGAEAFNFERSAEKLNAFMKWLQEQVDKGILEVGAYQQIGRGVNDAWTNLYILDSYKRGVIRARSELKKAGLDVPSVDATGGIDIVVGMPMHVDRVGLLFTRVFNDLKGVTTAMDTIISRVLAQGLADGDGPVFLAKKLVASINGTGMGDLAVKDALGRYMPAMDRAVLIARTEIIRAHHVATIMEYRNWGLEGIKVKAEWSTAGDGRVCFLANTKVKVKRGYKRIQDVKVGDYVLTHKDRYRKVLKIFHRKYKGNVVKITLKGGHVNPINLTATEEHPILVNNQWIKIKDIKVGDKLSYIAKKCPVCHKLMPVFNEVCSYQCASVRGNKMLWADPKQHERVREENRRYTEVHGISKIQIAKKAYMEKMKGEDFNAWFRLQVSKGQLESYKNNPIHLENVIKSNQEKGKRDNWGWKNKEKRNKDLIKARIAIGKNHNGKTYLEKKVEWWLKKEGIQYESQKYFNNGKRRFWVDFYLPEYNIIIEADGKYWHNEEDDRVRDDGLKQVFTGKILHFREDDIRNNFKECVSQFENIVEMQNCFVNVEVRKIKKWELEWTKGVYNLEVEEDNTYTANRIIVHNCSRCAALEGKVFTLNEIEPLIPLHPGCRCLALPYIAELEKLK